MRTFVRVVFLYGSKNIWTLDNKEKYITRTVGFLKIQEIAENAIGIPNIYEGILQRIGGNSSLLRLCRRRNPRFGILSARTVCTLVFIIN